MVAILVSAINIGIIFLLGCVGEIITEKSGHLNLGIPGIMCMGAAGACWGISKYMSSLSGADPSWFVLVLIAIGCGALFGALGGLIYSFLTVTLRSNQNVTGLALTIFGSGFTQYFVVVSGAVNLEVLPAASKILQKGLPFAKDLGAIGEILFGHGVLVYVAIAIAIVAAIVLRKTRVGLNLRAIGENPATADAAGINVNGYKYSAILIGSAVAGLGGMFCIFGYVLIGGVYDNTLNIQEYGWIAIALVIFTMWKPDLSILGAIIFGLLYILPSYIPASNAVKELIKLLPYLVTVIVLIVTSILDSKENQPPASLGVNYFREDR